MKIKIAADTSALLSLELSGLLKKSLDYFSFHIGPVIREELKRIAQTHDVLGGAALHILRFVEKGDITIVEMSQEESGETETVRIMKSFGCDFIISDDIKFAEKVSQNTDTIHFSVFVLFLLYHAGEISKKDAQKAVDAIFQKRSWTENLISLFARHLFQ